MQRKFRKLEEEQVRRKQFHHVPQCACTTGQLSKRIAEPGLGRNGCVCSHQNMAVPGEAQGSAPQDREQRSKQVSLSQLRCWSK